MTCLYGVLVSIATKTCYFIILYTTGEKTFSVQGHIENFIGTKGRCITFVYFSYNLRFKR